jgi:hypothetical protein
MERRLLRWIAHEGREPPPGAAVIFHPASFLGSQNGKKKHSPGLREKERELPLSLNPPPAARAAALSMPDPCQPSKAPANAKIFRPPEWI